MKKIIILDFEDKSQKNLQGSKNNAKEKQEENSAVITMLERMLFKGPWVK